MENLKVYQNPDRSSWSDLMLRPVKDDATIDNVVKDIFGEVRKEGDNALIRLTRKLDCADFNQIKRRVGKVQIDEDLRLAIDTAIANITKFHESQQESLPKVETSPGVFCWRRSVPIDRVGLYIPGGTAPLFSTLLMLAIPAQIAGCRDIIVCTPPNEAYRLHPVIEYTADRLGIQFIYNIGGAQAVAAMTHGTATVPEVNKIFGPGNQYVTKAKQLAQAQGLSIDMPAGPSELLVIADDTANPDFVAADLLSQAEHGADSQVILLCTSANKLDQITAQLYEQLKSLPRAAIAAQALSHSKFIYFNSIDDALDFSNEYAPEHLILAISDAEEIAALITNAGSVFIGHWACESAGDYASGTNHTLPTNGYARSYSGVSLDSFVKKITFQTMTPEGVRNLGPSVERMAEAEALIAHKRAMSLRLKHLHS